MFSGGYANGTDRFDASSDDRECHRGAPVLRPTTGRTAPAPRPLDRLIDFPPLIGVDHQSPVGPSASRINAQRRRSSSRERPTLILIAFQPRFRGQPQDLVIGISEPARRRRVRRIAFAFEVVRDAPLAARAILQHIERFAMRDRIRDVAQIERRQQRFGFELRVATRLADTLAPQVPHSVDDRGGTEVYHVFPPSAADSHPAACCEPAMSAVLTCSSVVPTTSGASALISAATHSSLPRPIVNVMP